MNRPCRRPNPRRSALAIALTALALLGIWQGVATTGAIARTVHFHGRAVEVPRAWPVYRLGRHPGMCVRLDRRAVYLGTPAGNQRCPADAIGRRRAILVEAAKSAGAGASALPV